MSEQNKPFVVTDRRKFTMDGNSAPRRRPIARARTARTRRNAPAPSRRSNASPPQPLPAARAAACSVRSPGRARTSAPPTASEMEQANAAYQQTAERLDTAVRAANPGMDHPPAMTLRPDRAVRST